MEHTAVSGSQTGLYCLGGFTRPFDWYFTEFSTCFTEYGTVLGPVLLNMGLF